MLDKTTWVTPKVEELTAEEAKRVRLMLRLTHRPCRARPDGSIIRIGEYPIADAD